ncbi:unnamed protein product [Pylaiella littoralis]
MIFCFCFVLLALAQTAVFLVPCMCVFCCRELIIICCGLACGRDGSTGTFQTFLFANHRSMYTKTRNLVKRTLRQKSAFFTSVLFATCVRHHREFYTDRHYRMKFCAKIAT